MTLVNKFRKTPFVQFVFAIQPDKISFGHDICKIARSFADFALTLSSYKNENTHSQYILTHFAEEDPTAITNGLL